MPLVSIVIPTWNGRALVSSCLSSIIRTRCSHEREIIVVDDASTDGTSTHLREHFTTVSLIENSRNRGYAHSVNRGVAVSRGEYIFLLNNDTEFRDDPVDPLVSFLETHKDFGVCAPMLVYPDGRFQISCRRFPTPAALLLEKLGICRLGPFRRWKMTVDEHAKGGTVPQPMASALLIKRECWDAVGPLDERFPIFYNDVDWCYRVYRDTNFTIALVTEVTLVHHEGKTINTLGGRKKRELYRSLIKFYVKHFPFKAEMVR